MSDFATLADAALSVLNTADAAEKARASRNAAAAWREDALTLGTLPAAPPERPARPARPELLPPREMPKRRAGGSPAARAALLHALAHIELNAIDLAWDMIARFGGPELPRGFYDDWVRVADEEGKHFLLLAERLEALGAAYGDLPAHDGLWEAAVATAENVAARLAVVPLVREARGLDVTPAMTANLRQAGDPDSAAVLQIIHDDEIGHVAIGKRWFDHVCARQGWPPVETYQDLVRRYFTGSIRPPFSEPSREAAGLTAAFYLPLVKSDAKRAAAAGD